MNAQHTPGPWRFVFNAEHRTVHLVGGQKRYDLTIMDFCRWGINGATMLLRDPAHDGMNIMHKLHERPDWIAPEPGREHHKSWHQLLTHPDIRLIEAAPDLLAALKAIMEMLDDEVKTATDAELAYGLSDHQCPDHVKKELACAIACRAAIAKAGGGV